MRGRAGRGPIRSGLWFGVGNKVAKAARAHGHMGGRIDDLEYVPATMAGERRLGPDRAGGGTARTTMPQIVLHESPNADGRRVGIEWVRTWKSLGVPAT